MASLTVMMAAPQWVRDQAPPAGRHMMMGGYDGCGGTCGPEAYYGDGYYYVGCYDGDCYGDDCYGGGGDHGGPYGHGHGGAMPKPGFTGPIPMGAGGTNPPIGYHLMNDVGVEGFL